MATDKHSDSLLWLENTNDQKVIDWVNKKTKLTSQYFERNPYSKDAKKTVEYFCNQPKCEIGILNDCVNDRNIFYLKADGSGGNRKLYKKNIDTGLETLLVDPLQFSKTDSTYINLVSISEDGKYLGLTFHDGGRDRCDQRVFDTRNYTLLPDTIERTIISPLEFYDDGFFYTHFGNLPKDVGLPSTPSQRLFYHKLGTDTSKDELIIDCDKSFSLKDKFYFSSNVFEGRYLVIRCTGSDVLWLCKNLSTPGSTFRKLTQTESKDRLSTIGSIDGNIYYISFMDAPNGQIVSIDLDTPTANLYTVIPESKNIIRNATCDCGKIFISYMDNAKISVKQFNKAGMLEHDIKTPFICTARTSCGPKTNQFTVLEVESFTSPKSLYMVDPETGTCKPLFQDKCSIDQKNYETRQVFYTSFDGTKVPMFIVSKKGNLQDKSRILVLSGYGASNVSNNPYFSYFALSLIEMGGIYAVANIRGGGEYGLEWYKSGIKENRTNCFNDFISGAEHLISEGYTSKEKLAIYGGSSGGTLVSACTNIRPDLFRVVISNSGLHDLLRFHKIGSGSSFIHELGNPENELDWKYLEQYSPIHSINSNFVYPAILVPVCENDDRVSPIHSYKLIQTFTEKKTKGGPFLLRVQKGGGHTLRNTSEQIIEFADILSFVLFNTEP